MRDRDAQAIREAVPGVERVVEKIEVEAWKVLSTTGRAKPRVVGVSSVAPERTRRVSHAENQPTSSPAPAPIPVATSWGAPAP